MPLKRRYGILLIIGMIPTLRSLAQTANFSVSKDTACAPAIINFTNLSIGNPTTLKWSFGDGRNSFENNPSVLYSTPGAYTVTLTAYYKDGSTSSASKIIQISTTPTVSFTSDSPLSCKIPFTVNFKDNSPGAISHTWSFGDGSSSITVVNDTISHIYQNLGKYDITLTATNRDGCSATLTRPGYVIAQQPSLAAFDITKNKYGCIPLTTSFYIETNNIVNDPVLNYQWDFGDPTSPGNLLTTNRTNVSHTYNNRGIYNVKILVTTDGGCKTAIYENQVAFAGTPPVANFTYLPSSPVCASQLVTISADTTNSNFWQWDIGDYGTAPIPSTNVITHKFLDTGNINITLIAYDNGCPSPLFSKSIAVNGPIANFSFQPLDCKNQDSMQFTSKSIGAYNWQWDFGDPSSAGNTSSSPNPVHIFSAPGLYNVKLKVGNVSTGCVDSISRQVYVLDLRPIITVIPRNACRGIPLTFGATDSLVYTKYTWYFGDGSPSVNGDSVHKAYSITGTYLDTLITTDLNNCLDTVIDSKPVTIEQPVAKFAVPPLFCFDQPALFKDESLPYNSNLAITRWKWDFGDGTSSDQQNPSKIYNISSGNVDYLATLIVTDDIGCSDTSGQSLKVNPTPVLIVPNDSYNICRGQSVSMNVVSDNPVVWSPASYLTCSNCSSPAANPPVDTQYLVSSSNVFGCINKDTIKISVAQPFTISAIPKSSTICPGNQVALTVNGGAVKYLWNIDSTLNCSTCTNPIAKPDSSTRYYVTGYDSTNCFTATDSVSVDVLPAPVVSAGPTQTVTVGSSVQLNAVSAANIKSWQWTPSDYLSCTSCPNPISTPTDVITYKIKVTDDQGCTDSSTVAIHLICSNGVVFIPNTFTPNGDGINDIFYPRGKGVKVIHWFRIFNRWGQKVFERDNFTINDVSNGWNGTYKGLPASAGVYIYETEMVCDNNEVFRLKGNITLLR